MVVGWNVVWVVGQSYFSEHPVIQFGLGLLSKGLSKLYFLSSLQPSSSVYYKIVSHDLTLCSDPFDLRKLFTRCNEKLCDIRT